MAPHAAQRTLAYSLAHARHAFDSLECARDHARRSMNAAPAEQEFGKYRLLRKLAQGGMAEIFLAIQQGIQGFEKVVVIKRVLPELSASDEFVQMFLDEARVAAKLDHQNIVRIYDLGEVSGQYYIAME